MTGGAGITALATAFPAARSQTALWDEFFCRHFAQVRWAERVYRSAGARQRRPSVDPTVDDISRWSTAARMRRYQTEAMPLAKDAASQALNAAGVAARDIGLLALVSCTGYATPGIDVGLARDLGFAPGTERVLIGHMGCHAALPALGLVADYVSHRGRPALVLSVELPSLHIQPPADDLDDVLAHALFSDAAAAAVLSPAPAASGLAPGQLGLAVVDIEAGTDLGAADHISWEVTDLGFHMGLSRQVPALVARHVGPVVDALLARHGLGRADVKTWGAHPGGPRILDAVGQALELPTRALEVSREVLADYGNCSSATILVVLQQLQLNGDLHPGEPAVLLAFGPGLTIYALLLRAQPVAGPRPS